MSAATELAALAAGTRAFVAADPEIITLQNPVARVADGAGGWTETAGPDYIETVRLIPQSDKVPVTATWEGAREKVEYVMMAEPEARDRIEKGATFIWRGQTWLVAQLHDKPAYEFKADVILHAG